MRRATGESERGFTLVEIVIAAGVGSLILGVLLLMTQSAFAGAKHTFEFRRGYTNVERTVQTWDDESQSALAIFVPRTDVLGQPNADGHEFDFYTRDAAKRGVFWAYRFDAGARTLQRYTYATPGSAASANGAAVDNIAGMTATHILASTLTTPALGGYVPKDVAVRFGFPDVVGGNAITKVRLTNAYNDRTIELLPGTFPSGFTIVVGTYTPPPTQPPTTDPPTSAPACGQAGAPQGACPQLPGTCAPGPAQVGQVYAVNAYFNGFGSVGPGYYDYVYVDCGNAGGGPDGCGRATGDPNYGQLPCPTSTPIVTPSPTSTCSGHCPLICSGQGQYVGQTFPYWSDDPSPPSQCGPQQSCVGNGSNFPTVYYYLTTMPAECQKQMCMGSGPFAGTPFYYDWGQAQPSQCKFLNVTPSPSPSPAPTPTQPGGGPATVTWNVHYWAAYKNGDADAYDDTVDTAGSVDAQGVLHACRPTGLSHTWGPGSGRGSAQSAGGTFVTFQSADVAYTAGPMCP